VAKKEPTPLLRGGSKPNKGDDETERLPGLWPGSKIGCNREIHPEEKPVREGKEQSEGCDVYRPDCR